jgi:hypothetical protein
VLQISHSLLRRKLCRSLDGLKDEYALFQKVCKDLFLIQSNLTSSLNQESTLDELDEYVMLLETHRIKLVAKLKSVFDRFDASGSGKLSGVEVEQALVYMHRPVDSAQVFLYFFCYFFLCLC